MQKLFNNAADDTALQTGGVMPYAVSFKKTGNEYQSFSNVVSVGADDGKLRLNEAGSHENLVTEGVASCVAVIAVNRQTAEAGLWHLYHHQDSEGIARDMMPVLEKHFAPATTDIYLIGGKSGLSERLVGNIQANLAAARFAVTDAVLYPEERLDIAVSIDGGIYVAPENVPAYLFYKPGPFAGGSGAGPSDKVAVSQAPKPAY